jgi:hypothetical protein
MEILDRDLDPVQEKTSVLFISLKLYCILTLPLSALNVYLAYFVTFNAGGNSDKSIAIQGSLVVIYMFAPVASLALAILFALFPYKGKTYKQKYLPVSLFIYLILNIAFLLLLLIALNSMKVTR